VDDPLALLIGMVLDQQVPLEKAFAGPWVLRQRLGTKLDAAKLAAMPPADLTALFVERLRFIASQGNGRPGAGPLPPARAGYDGTRLLSGRQPRTGDELFKRVKALPGFGEHKARIFVALLAKQLGVRPKAGRRPRDPSERLDHWHRWPTSTARTPSFKYASTSAP